MTLLYTSFFGRSGLALPNWQTVLSSGVLVSNAGWNGYTVRQWFDSSSYLVSGGTQIRATLTPGASAGCTFDFCYIGHAAAAGDVYDFETTPTQLLFSGAAGATISAGNSLVSDGVSFVLNPAKDLIISCHFSATSSIGSRTFSSGVHQGYYKNASDASTVNATGYSTLSASYLVSKVEILV